MKRYLVLILGLAVAAVSAAGLKSIPVGEGDLIIYGKNYHDSSASPVYVVDATYPQIRDFSDEKIQERVNSEIDQTIMSQVDNFKREMADWNETDIPIEAYSYYEFVFHISMANHNIFSTELVNYSYYKGAAHPNSDFSALNYDMNSGDKIELKDLFKPGSDYLDVISKYCIGDLVKQWDGDDYSDDEWLKQGAGPNEDNFKTFLIMQDGIKIVFDAYQVAAYAAGPQEVTIPYSVMMSIIDKDGILKPFL